MKKISVIKLCGEIQSLSILITNVMDHDVFVDYSGHVNVFVVRIVSGGWHEGMTLPKERKKVYLHEDGAEQMLIDLKKELENLLGEVYAIADPAIGI